MAGRWKVGICAKTYLPRLSHNVLAVMAGCGTAVDAHRKRYWKASFMSDVPEELKNLVFPQLPALRAVRHLVVPGRLPSCSVGQ